MASTGRPLILATCKSTESPRGLSPHFIEMIEEHFDIVWWKDFEIDRSKYVEKIRGILAIFYGPPITDNLISSMPNLKIVSNHGVGVNHIDVAMVNRYGVKVSNTPDTPDGAISGTCADLAIALMLASAKQVVQGDKITHSPETIEFDINWMGNDVNGATIGIVGMGRIGYKVAERAKCFNMKILYFNRKRRSESEEQLVGAVYCESLDELLQQADYIVLMVPLTPETKGLISEKQFSLMKPNVTVINIARGPVIDQDALVQALQSKKIKAAALDVSYPEPLPRDHPLLTFPNVIITPHLGTQTVETREKIAQRALDNLIAGIDSKPLISEVKPL